MFYKLLFRVLLISVGWGKVNAQQPALYFDRLTTQDGLSHNKVNCILRDRRGFMWLGTNDGLNRYDGHQVVVFHHKPGDSTSISGNIINDILEDEKGVLWIATADGGLSRYDYRKAPREQFKQYRHWPGYKHSLPVNILNKLLLDRQGYLWIGTSGAALLRFDRVTGRYIEPVPNSTRTILDMEMDQAGTLWVGRVGGGMLQVNLRTLQHDADPAYKDLYAKLPHVSITAIYADQDQVWFGSWDKKLYCRSTLSGEERVFERSSAPFSFQEDEINCFTRDRQGRLWMGGRFRGLQIYDEASGRFYNYRYDAAREGTVADNRINCLYTDTNGVIWVGTDRGISLHRPAQQQFEQTFLPPVPGISPGSLTIYDFYERNGELWIGTSAGIYIRSAASGQISFHPIHYKGARLSITKFYEDVDGTVYLGTDYSLFRLHLASLKVSLLPNTDKDRVMNKVIESRVVSILRDTVDGHPVLMAAPYGHFIAYYDLIDQRWVSRHDTTKNIIDRFRLGGNNLIRKLYKTRDGRLWLTSVTQGLAMQERRQEAGMRFFFNDPGNVAGISNNHVYDVVEDGGGNLWVSTYGGGLHCLDRTQLTFTHVTASNNLLEGVQVDGRGHVWMISNGHLHKYDPMRKSYTSFDLPDMEKTGGVRGDIFKDRKGRLYAAGGNYFIAFDPWRVRDTRHAPQVYFTDFKIFNKSHSDLLEQSKIQLSYDQNYFTVAFAAPDYSLGRQTQYAYMLEGRDQDWIPVGTQTAQEFSNLEAKEYVLKVKATNHTGAWEEKVAVMPITIIPPFWQRWWFYVLCALCTGVIIYIIYSYRIGQLLKQQVIRNKIAQDLHDNIGSTLSSISVYSQVARIYHEQERKADLQLTLEKISDTSGEMISEMNDIVWAINPRHDSMDTILQRMESFARPLLASRGIAFHFALEPRVKGVNLDMTHRKNFYLIFKEAVNNVLKYAQCSNLWVNIDWHHHHLELEVRDDGRGFDREKVQVHASQSLSGNGLRNMEMRAQEMKGVWTIHSRPGEGTRVHLRFPAL